MKKPSHLLLSLAVFVIALQASALPPEKKWEAWLELGGYGATDDASRGETNAFIPLWQDATTLFFFQGKGKFFEDDVQEGNLALGLRQVREDFGWSLGGWAGWDVRHTDAENTFHQFALGIEALSPLYDLRMNGYVPITDPKDSPGLAKAKLSGGNIVMVGGEEVPLYGLDGEVGLRVLGGSIFDREQALRVYAGGYWFDDDEAEDDVSGPRVRAEWRVHDVIPGFPGTQLALELQFQHDDLRDSQFEGGIRLQIPFGPKRTARADLTPHERRMTESIVRDTDIRTQRSEAEGVVDALTHAGLDRVVHTDGGDDLQTVVDAAGPNSLIIAQGDNGTIAGNVTVGARQTLQGGGSTIRVRGRHSGTTARFRAPGSQPLVQYLMNGPVLEVDHQTHIAGLVIEGAGMGSGFGGNDGIFGGTSGLYRVAATHNVIQDTGGHAVGVFSSSRHLTLSYNTVLDVGDNGFQINSESMNAKVTYNTITNPNADGIKLNSESMNARIAYNDIRDTGDFGIKLNSESQNAWVAHNRLRNIGTDGIRFNNLAQGARVSHNWLEDIGGIGIDFSSGHDDIRVAYNRLANVGSTGIDFSSGNSDIWVNHNRLTDIGAEGIDFSSGNDNVEVRRNVLLDIDLEGIDFTSGNSFVWVDRNRITNANRTGSDAYLGFSSGNSDLRVTGNVLIGRGGASSRALDFSSGNSGTVSNNEIRGAFTDDIIRLDNGNALGGHANVLDATFGGLFCNITGVGNSGGIGFENGASCP